MSKQIPSFYFFFVLRVFPLLYLFILICIPSLNTYSNITFSLLEFLSLLFSGLLYDHHIPSFGAFLPQSLFCCFYVQNHE